VAVVEQICGAGGRCSFLHDDYSDVSHIEIDLPIDVESADGHRNEHRAGGERKHLVIVAKCFGIREEEIVCELILQIRIEGVSRTRR
jgi:hypothetical protein